MKSKNRLFCLLSAVLLCCTVTMLSGGFIANAASANARVEQYRPQLSFTPSRNWNNDPNGLVYAEGVYHMYFQYATTGNAWDTMHWGHAESTDLVHWTEKEIAILPNMPGWNNYDATAPSGPIFSGSAVYVSEADVIAGSQAYNGAGFYAVFTQPNQAPVSGVGDQRQCIAYSADGSTYPVSSFQEIVANNYDSVGDGSGAMARGDFRDPKVFWDESANEWVMVVGGGEIVQFTSKNLKDWEYAGTTGFWGECPDLFPLDTDSGGEKWVLVLSPEDKPQSHSYNNTNRSTHEYPNEFYIIGSRGDNGVFKADAGETLRQISIGIDCYAIQTFNGLPGGRRVGVSWSANWKTTGDYAEKGSGGLRDCWNGGMTMLYELGLKETDGKFFLTKNPVSEYEVLRSTALAEKRGVTLNASNALQGVRSNLAEIDLTLDVTNTQATEVELKLALSEWEETVVRYDITDETLIIDRSKSSLSAKDTSRYGVEYSSKLIPNNGKVRIRAFLDWGYLTIFGGSGEASATVAIFPSLSSDGMNLTADEEISADVTVYSLNSIWGNETERENFTSFYLSSRQEMLNVGESFALLPSSPSSAFNADAVTYTVRGDAVKVNKQGNAAIITAITAGEATVTAEYGGITRSVNVKAYEDTVVSDINFGNAYAGKWYKGNGYTGSSVGDGFVFSSEKYRNFTLTATVTALENSQAAGIVFSAGDNYYTYYCASYDYKDKVVKLWMSGGETIAEASLALRRGEPVKFGVMVINGEISIFVNGRLMIETSHDLYTEGRVGLNVYNGNFIFNNIKLSRHFAAGEDSFADVGEEDFSVQNLNDRVYLNTDDYTVLQGKLSLNESYLRGLYVNTQYKFCVLRGDGSTTEFSLMTPSGPELSDSYKTITGDKALTVGISAGGAEILEVFINGKSTEFRYERSRVIIDADKLVKLTDGDYTLRIVTDRGSLDYVFNFKTIPPVPVDITGIVVSIVAASIAFAALAAFAVFWIITGLKRKNIFKV